MRVTHPFHDGAASGPKPRARWAGPLLAAVASIALAGCGEGAVVRIVDGRPERGRFISETAYALFGRGAEAEALGDLGGAITWFERAAYADPDSPEIWTRLGALQCQTGPTESAPPAAEAAFARAEELDPAFAPAHRERARCLLGKSGTSPATALAEAERALALDPDDLGTALVHAAALHRAGRGDDARFAYLAAAVRRPGDREAWAALLDHLAHTRADMARVLGAERVDPRTVPPRTALAPVDAALRAGDVAEARRRAQQARLPSGELAVRAAALGRASFARDEAALVVGADPADASARIALAAAADLLHDSAALAAALRGLPRKSTPPSPLARLLFAELLARRDGAEAARAWLGAATTATSEDPVLAATEQRVRAAIARP